MTNWGWAPNGRTIGLAMDVWYEGDINWNTPSVQVHMVLAIRAQFITKDTSNNLNWWGRSSGSKTNPVYWTTSRTTDWQELEHTVVTVDLQTGQSQWIEWGARLSGIDTAGGTMEVYNGVTIPGRPYAVSQPTYSTTDITLGQQIGLNTNRQQSWFTHSLFWRVNGSEWALAVGGIGQTAEWTPSIDIANNITGAPSGAGQLLLQTFDGGTFVGDSVRDVTFNVPSNIVPVPGTMVITEANESIAAIVGSNSYFVQNNSKLKIEYPGHSGVYGSTGLKMETIIDGTLYITSGIDPWISPVLNKSGPITVTKRFTDTRGRVASYSQTINVIAYSPPALTSLLVPRTNSSGGLVSNGTYGKVSANGSVSPIVVSGQHKNTLTYTIWSRQKGAPEWTVKKSATTLALGTVTLNASDVINGPYSAIESYEFQVEVKDKISNAIGTYSMPTEIIPLAIAEQGIGVGKAWERGGVDSVGEIYVSGEKVVPAGSVFAYAGDAAPYGYLKADGSAVSRTVYAELFTKISTKFGGGNGTTTFNLPNLSGRIPVGIDTATPFNAIGNTGGEVNHALTEAENGPHTHPFYGGWGPGSLGQGYFRVDSSSPGNLWEVLRPSGEGRPHNNMQPYIIMQYIIKY